MSIYLKSIFVKCYLNIWYKDKQKNFNIDQCFAFKKSLAFKLVFEPGGVDGDDGLHVLKEVDFGVGAGARRRLDRQEQRLVGRNLSERKDLTLHLEKNYQRWFEN